MLVCQKCGRSFPEDGLQTICPTCLAPLVSALEAAAEAREAEAPAVAGQASSAAQAAAATKEARGQAALTEVQAASRANVRAASLALGAWVLAFMSIWLAGVTVTRGGAPAALILAGTMAAGAAWMVWRWSCWSWVNSVEVSFPDRIECAQRVPFTVTIAAAKQLGVDRAEISLVARERSYSGSRVTGSSELMRLSTTAASSFQLSPWKKASLQAALQIPPDAVPSFKSESFGVDWQVRLWVALPGWHSDVRERMPATVVAVRADERAAVPPEREFSLEGGRDFRASVSLAAERDARGHPVLRTSERTRGKAIVVSNVDAPRAAIFVRLRCVVLSSGHTDERVPYSSRIYEGALTPGERLERPFEIGPLDGPITFAGKIFEVNWWLEVELRPQGMQWRRAQIPVTLAAGWRRPGRAQAA